MSEENGWMSPDPDDRVPTTDLATDRAHSARVYDYIMGGKDNFPADRESAERTLAAWPQMRPSMLENRSCMHRIVRHLAGERGIDQFLDVGTGIPSSPNLHEVAQGVNPAARIVYVDNDPIVLAHARALLTGTDEGRTAYIDGDLRTPEKILADPALRDTLDLGRPVALTAIAILQFLPDTAVAEHVGRLLAALPSGSFFALTTATLDTAPDRVDQVAANYRRSGIDVTLRSRAEVEALVARFDGLDLQEPGVVLINRWRPADGTPAVPDSDVGMYAALARKR